jgi:hypothetical protein
MLIFQNILSESEYVLNNINITELDVAGLKVGFLTQDPIGS